MPNPPELHARIADALVQELGYLPEPADEVAVVLLALPGIAIVDADEYKQLLELVASADTIMEQMETLLAAAAEADHA